ncbi:MAG: PQQ-like beta-propeller repeat protein [Planctomycetes bacterium]|nr:PQQ-like beta-propeller repeat protein [Planctomycetota bacterium]
MVLTGQWAFAALAGAQLSASTHCVERSWTHLAGNSNRLAMVSLPAPPISVPAWIRSTDINGNLITFIGQAGVAVYAGTSVNDGLVFAAGRISPVGQPANQYRLFAFSRSTGVVRWQSAIPTPYVDSFASPAIDERNGVVIYASGNRVRAFRMTDGSLAWERTLTRNVVNASPVVTDDLQPGNRVFITDYDGNFGGGKLYCINADPYHPQRNPFQPGDLVWSVPIGSSSGNSPSYLPRSMGGVPMVYVSSVGGIAGTDPGRIYAFPITVAPPEPNWVYLNEIPEGYFGGVCVAPPPADSEPGSPPIVYAAAYAFSGGADTANLVKLNALTGAVIWTVGSNRTQSIPVPLPGGRIALSAGLEGYGTLANVQLFDDLGDSAALLWDTAGFFIIGGWTHQPVATQFGGRDVLAVGAPPTGFFDTSSDLYLVDLALGPSSPDFMIRRYSGAGGSPAIVGSTMYSVGTSGLVAFGPTPSRLDVDGDNTLCVKDLYSWDRGEGQRDVNADGAVDSSDRQALLLALRASEPADMKGGRR